MPDRLDDGDQVANAQPIHTQTIVHLLKQEPLVHFLGIAALLFVANALFSGDDREVITVDASTWGYMVQQQQELLREMTEAEKAEVVERFIEDEILVREARKRGFENSSRIRALLLQNMRFSPIFLAQASVTD